MTNPVSKLWTDQKNQRRCSLIDQEHSGILSLAELLELQKLQKEMCFYIPVPTKYEFDRLRTIKFLLEFWEGDEEEQKDTYSTIKHLCE